MKQSHRRISTFTPPSLRKNNVVRSDCLRKLDGIDDFPIVGIVSSAGSGKSVLLRQFYDRLSKRIDRLWISLDEQHASLSKFWRTLMAGIEHLDSSVKLSAQEHFNHCDSLPCNECVDILYSELEGRSRPLGVFVDDLHQLTDPAAGAFLRRFVNQNTPLLRLFATMRPTPELGLDRLKVQNSFLEFSWDELAFDEDETHHFLTNRETEGASSNLSPDDISRLFYETEGWAAGLQLALLRSNLNKGGNQFSQAAGRYGESAERYFENEIFESFSDETQLFLLHTSVLDRFNAELSAAVSGIEIDQAGRIISELQRSEFLMIDLGVDGNWKRYHHLVHDFLQSFLVKANADDSDVLLSRASRWCEQNNLVHEAVEYAIRGRDYDRAAGLIEAQARVLLGLGSASDLVDWIEQLPDEVLVRKPRLPLILSLMVAQTLQPSEIVEFQYDKAKQVIATLKAVDHFDSEEAYLTLEAELDVSLIAIWFSRGNMLSVVERSEHLLTRNIWIGAEFKASLHNMLGYAYYSLGHYDQARTSYDVARVAHLEMNCTMGVMFADAFRGMLELTIGRSDVAESYFNKAINVVTTSIGEGTSSASAARLYLYLLRYETGELSAPSEDFDHDIDHARVCSDPETYAVAILVQSRVYELSGKPEEAKGALKRAVEYADQIRNDTTKLEVYFARMRYAILNGEISLATEIFASAQRLWEDDGAEAYTSWNRKRYWADLFRGEMFLATAQPKLAVSIFRGLVERTAQTKRVRRQIMACGKLAVALSCVGDNEAALKQIGQALGLARSSRLVRPLLDCGDIIIQLVRAYREDCASMEMEAFLDSRILTDVDERGVVEQARDFDGSVLAGELTEREIDILRELVKGAKNKEICLALNLTENTVKWYFTRIFEKLGVNNRTEAAMIAKSIFAAL